MFLIDEKTAELVHRMCDVALRSGGLQSMEAVQHVLQALSRPTDSATLENLAKASPSSQGRVPASAAGDRGSDSVSDPKTDLTKILNLVMSKLGGLPLALQCEIAEAVSRVRAAYLPEPEPEPAKE